jgi:hypothetical protein
MSFFWRRVATYLVFVALYFMLASLAFADSKIDAHDMMNTYDEQVISIDKGSGEIVAKEFLLEYEPFVKLAAEGAKNIDACIEFLASKGHSHQQLMIAILSMHSLEVQDYVSFLNRLAGLFDRGLVSPYELGLAVVPSYAFSTVIIENYSQGAVQSALREIAARPNIRPSTKSAIESILSGKALGDMKAFRRDCCSGPGAK